jgi:DNA (cytosine-5)-methyltransferase 1
MNFSSKGDVAHVSGSIFSGGGIGDCGIEWGLKIPVIAACELISSRADLIRLNFPKTRVFEGDIWNLKNAYVKHFQKTLTGKRPWLLTLSPPCQGMSANGAGKISAAINSGKRPKEDARNRLILPGIEVVEQLQPQWFLIENVRRMENTVIRNELNKPENILNCIARRLHPHGYTIRSNILDFRDYGVPHHRERLITIGCRDQKIVTELPQIKNIFSENLSILHPKATHGENTSKPWVSLKSSIGKLPALDAQKNLIDPKNPFHCVPKWNSDHYFWMDNTPEGETAFDNNLCPVCNYTSQNKTDVICSKCNSLLPKPTIIKNGQRRLIKGFRTSYRRLTWNKPGSTLTMNSGVISSDMKGHPDQNRVLSLHEILILSTISCKKWKKKFRFFKGKADDKLVHKNRRLIRDVVGESIPPLALYKIVENLKKLSI